MRRRLWLFGLGVLGCLFLWGQPNAHNVSSAEYFWDTDPGQGNGSALSAADGNLDEVLEALLANSAAFPAAPGSHAFYVRVRANGVWSPAFRTIVHRDQNTTTTRVTEVVVGEYFWDADPGLGAGSPLIALDANFNEALEAVRANATAPAMVGAHTFNLRVQDADNQWSNLFSTVVHVDASNAVLRSLRVDQAEYFWDTDPGLGAGSTLLAADGQLDEVIEEVLANGIGFPAAPGGHTFHVRVKDADGQWSPDFSTLVYRDVNTTALKSAAVAQAEYFWDTDPGQGAASPLLALDGNLGEVVEAVLRNGLVFPASAGGHTFNLRVRDADGQWSGLFTTVVLRDTLTPSTRAIAVTQAEYFWDTDPGIGSGLPVLAFDGTLNEAVEELLADNAGFPAIPGAHTFNLRVRETGGQWSPLFATTVVRDTLQTVTRIVRVAQVEYFWDADPGLGNGSPALAQDGSLNEAVEALRASVGTSTMSGGPHRFSYRVQDAAGAWGPSFTTIVHVQGGYFPVDSIQGPKDYCGAVPGAVQTYRVDTTGIGNNTFSWLATNGVITSGQNTRQVTVLWTAGQSLYTLQAVTCAFGICDTILDTITVHPLPVANAGPDRAYCAGGSATLNGSGGALFLWTPASGLSSATIANPVANPTSTTQYVLRVTDLNGCQDTDTMVVTVRPLPIASAGNDTTICTGGTATLRATGGVGYAWSPMTGLGSPNAAITTAQPGIGTTYTVTVTDAFGCAATDQVAVSINSGPVVDAGTNATICAGASTQLSGTAGLSSYAWTPSAGLSDPSIRNPFAAPLTTTTYTLVGTNALGCANSDVVTVTVHPLPTVNAGADVSVCQGSSTTLGASGAATYAWTPSAGLSSTTIANPVATPAATTTYTVTGTAANGCQNTDQVLVTVLPLPNANAGLDVTICSGDSTRLNATGGLIYAWTPSTGLSNPAVFNPWAKPAGTTDYRLLVTDANGCTRRDTVRVTVSNCSVSLGRAVLQAEYFWDTDPGIGNGFAMTAADGGLNEAVEGLLRNNLNIPASPGGHILFVRVRDFRNLWSPIFRTIVTTAVATNGTRPITLSRAEYFWGADPGQGSGTPLLAVDGAFGEVIEELFANGINLPVTTGPHTFNLRIQDAAGNWSPLSRTLVQRLARTGFNRPVAVTQAEYFWNTDPGTGNGVPMIAVDGNLDEVVEALLRDPISLPPAIGPQVLHVRVKDVDNQWSSVFRTVVAREALTALARPVEVSKAEFFWDVDPGQGAATPMLIADGNLNEAVEALFSNGLPVPTAVGHHTFNVRVQDTAAQWSPLFTTVVYQGNVLAALRSARITQAEYFWNNDPGLGNGTALFAVDGSLNEVVEELLRNAINLPAALGGHTFNVRVKDVDNQWASAFQTMVVRSVNTVGNRDIKLVQAEYYWNADPGLGNGTTMLAVDGSLNEVWEDLFRNAINLPGPIGAHNFSVRVKAVDNSWSDPFTMTVYRGVNTVGTRPIRIAQAEYFWNTDPGLGNGTPLIAVDGTLNEMVEELFRNTIALPAPLGNHVFNVRVKDINNQWSDLFRTLVVRGAITVGNRDVKLVQAEYFWNTDPGQGNGTAFFATDGNLNEAVEELFRNGLSLPGANGNHVFNVRVKDVDNQWSDLFKTLVVRGTITVGNRNVAVARGEYFWDTDPGVGNGTAVLAVDGTYNEAVENLFRFINVIPLTNALHVLNMRVRDVSGLWSPVFRTVVDVNVPDVFVQTAIVGNFDFCGTAVGPNQTYSVTNVANVNYAWAVTGGTIVAGQGTSAIQVNWAAPSGLQIVRVVGCVGTVCDTLRDTLTITPLPNPNITPLNPIICQGGSVQLTATGGVSYVWTPATGLNNRFLSSPVAQPSATTTYTVSVTNAAGCVGSGSVTVTVLPALVVDAGPNISTCVGASVQLNGTGGVSYVWQPAAFLNNANIANPIASPPVTTTFLLTATNAQGCTGTDTVRVTVGSAPPTIACAANITQPNDLGQCSAIVNYTAPIGVDNCPGSVTTLIAGPAPGASFPVGTTTVTYRVTDTEGLIASCSFTVTVSDIQAPAIACYADTTIFNANGQCGRIFSFLLPATMDNCPGVTVTQQSSPPSGSFFNVGVQNLQFRAEDLSGNSSICTWHVTVLDLQVPVATCPAPLSVNVPIGQCSATATFTAPSLTDNCPGGSIALTQGLPSGSVFPIGTTQQVFTATDASGNVGTCSFDVTVIDNRLPSITCPASINTSNSPGQCGGLITYTTPIGTDNCPGATTVLTAGLASGSLFPSGSTTVTYTVTDPSGNAASCSFIVTVADVESPSITCPANILLQNEPDSCGALVAYSLPVFTDNCPGATLTRVSGSASGSHFPVGNTPIVYVVTDGGGRTDTCAFSVNIVDSTYPVVLCPNDTTILASSATCNRLYEYVVTAYDNCPRDSLVRTAGLASGAVFPLGTTYNAYLIIDASDNRDSCHFNVTVIDGSVPTISCPSNITAISSALMCGVPVTYAAPVGTDNCAGSTIAMVTGLASGSNFPVGATVVSYRIHDLAGQADTCSFIVTVLDNTPPSITCPANISVNPISSGCFAIVNFSAPVGTDNCPGTVTTQIAGPPSGSSFPGGTTTTLTFRATDAVGLTATCSFSVSVGVCNNAPSAVCQSLTVSTNSVCQGTATAATFDGGSSDPDGDALTFSVLPAGPYPLGTTAVVLTVTDIHGAADTCHASITVVDGTPPSITCPAHISVPNDPGLCGAVVSYATPGGTDNCSGGSTLIIAGQVSGTNFTVGTTLNTYRVTDAAGNTATCSFNVTVVDVENPTITCPSTQLRTNAPGQCGANVSYPTPIANDNCPGETLVRWSGLASGSFFPVGTSTVTYRVEDAAGQDVFCAFQLIVSDVTQPAITCPAPISLPATTGACGAIVHYTAPVGTDNCPGANTVLSAGLASGSPFPVSTTAVTYTVLDNAGNQATCTFQVTVFDSGQPSISCPAPIAVNNDLNACGAVATYLAPNGSDNCSSALTMQVTGLGSGATFPVGTTVNTFTVTDQAGNADTCAFTVTVTDAQAPAITCPANLFVNAGANTCDSMVTYLAPVGMDNCPGATTAISGGLPSGSVFGVGTTTQSYTVTDAAGNSTTCTFDVTVIDQVLPQLTCPPAIQVGTDPGLCAAVVNFVAPVGTDNCLGAVTTQIGGLASGSAFPRGTTQVTYRVVDAFGNDRTCFFFVTVTDMEHPQIACPTALTLAANPGGCGRNVSYIAPVGTDNCPGSVTALTSGQTSGSFFAVGNHVVTYTVTDGAAHSATCSFSIAVEDNELPSIACPASISVGNDPQVCGAAVVYVMPDGVDNCGSTNTSLVAGLSSGAVFPVGVTMQTYTATDSSGNSVSCSFTFTVVDVQNPNITCPNDVFLNVDPGACAAVVTYLPPVGTDNCPGATTAQVQGLGTGSTFPIGQTLEVFEVTDAVGRRDTCHIRVRVIDNALPTLTCPGNLSVFNDPGQCGATIAYVVPVGQDNCLGAITIQTHGLPSGSFFPVGTRLQTFVVTDAYGNTGTCSFTVNVSDNEHPSITCPAAIAVNSAPGGCGHVVSYITPIGTDNCVGASTVQIAGLGSGGSFPVGTTIETFVVSDAGFRTDTCSFAVTVADNQAPAITCPADIIRANDLNACGAVVAYAAPVGVDNCANAATMQLAGLSSLAVFPIGTTINTFVVADNSGLLDTCSFSVTVNEVQPPSIVCPANITVAAPAGTCAATVLYATPMGFDNCPGATTFQPVGLPSGSSFGGGTNLLTFVSTDVYGNVDSCSFAIFVLDQELPQLGCLADTVIATDLGQCSAVFVYPTPVGTDNCSNPLTIRTTGLPSGATFGLGNHVQTFLVTDVAGNTATCDFSVLVQDRELPRIVCPANPTVPAQAGGCGAVVSYVAPVGTDNCPGATTVRVQGLGAGAFFPVGVTEEVYVVTDGAGNRDTCRIRVTVLDNELPGISCPVNIVRNNQSGLCGALVNYPIPVGLDNCGGATTVLSGGLGSGALFPVGITGESYTVTDSSGNSATCAFSITVFDVEHPHITCPVDTQVIALPGVCVVPVAYLTPVGLDNCPGAVTTLVRGLPSGSSFNLGTILVRFLVQDAQGQLDSCEFNVVVRDAELPTLSCPANISQINDPGVCGATVSYAVPVGTDNCAGVVTSLVLGYASGATFPVGLTTVTYQAIDAGGNAATCSFTVDISDQENPAILCQAPIILPADLGGCGTSVVYALPVGTDNCPLPGTVQIAGLPAGALHPVGVTFNIYQVTDASSNTAQCSVQVTVLDNELPSITCPANLFLHNAPGQCGQFVTYIAPIGIDNCTAATTLQNRGLGSGSFFPVGTTAENFVVTDQAGNVDSCSFSITVLDVELPVVTCPVNVVQPADPGACNAVVTYITPVGLDNCAGVVTNLTRGLPSGATFPLGTTLVRYLVFDTHALVDSCDFAVTVQDLEAPVLLCPANVSLANDPGVCGAVLAYPTPVGTDNCLGVTTQQTLGLPSGALFPVGMTMNTFVATDAFGNSTSCSFTIMVTDQEAPQIVCPADPVVISRVDTCGNWVNYVPPVGNDNCSGATTALIAGLGNGNFFPVGMTTEVYVVMDGVGLRDTCAFVVHVLDQLAPVVQCPADISVGTDPGQCGAIVAYASAIAFDNCTGVTTTVVAGPQTGTFFGLGSTTVSFTATDGSSNSASCSFLVTVTDNEAPAVTCPANISVNNDPGVCGATVSFSASATDNCAGVGLTYSAASGSVFNVGATVVTATATDVNGNNASCTFTVNVTDNEAPAITCPANISVNNDPGVCGAAVSFNASATDNCAGVGVSYSAASSSVFNVGATVVTATATDVNGNNASCSFTVNVTDNEAPAIICPANISVNNDPGVCGATVSFSASATDNCAGVGLAYSAASGSGFNVGATVVTATATDVNGNSAVCTFNVTVADNQAPAITCPANIAVNNDPGVCGAAVSFNASATDNCAGVGLAYSAASGSVFNVGATVVTATATDVNGNNASCTFSVTVADNQAPAITCPPNIAVNNDPGVCGAAVNFSASAMDNCAGVGLAYSHAGGSVFGIGVTVVTATATDASGNTAVCTFNVAVNDNEAPTVVCPANFVLDSDPGVCGAPAKFTVLANDNCSFANVVTSHVSSSVFPVGLTVVSATATDNQGLVSTCTFTVLVSDVEVPVAICRNFNLTLDANGQATLAANMLDDGSFDNCSFSLAIVGQTNFTCQDVGSSFALTLVVTDSSGNTASCISTVTVSDPLAACNQAPVAICQDLTVGAGANCMATVNPVAVGGNSFDPEGGAVSFQLIPAGPYALGVHEVDLVVTDAGGATDTCDAAITVVDQTPPTAICMNVSLNLNTQNAVLLTPGQVNNGSFDNCSAVSMSISVNRFDCSNLGPNSVVLTVVDAVGLSANCTAIVTVRDTIPPVAVCRPVTLFLSANGVATLTPQMLDNGSFDNCGIASMTTLVSNYDCSMVGSEPVSLTVVDFSGNSATCFAPVTVLDTFPPVAICRDTTLYLNGNGIAVVDPYDLYAGPADNCGVRTVTLPQVAYFCGDVGVNSMMLTVTDFNYNSTTCNVLVTVVDSSGPTISCTPIVLLNVAAGQCAASTQQLPQATAQDNCGLLSLTNNAPSSFPVGSSTVIWTAVDNGGLSSVCTTAVSVRDNEAPAFSFCPANRVATTGSNCQAAVTWTAPVPFDNCGIVALNASHASGAVFNPGTTTVTYSAFDAAGNSGVCSFTVTVVVGPMTASTQVLQQITCHGGQNGSVRVNVNGGCAPYSYLWSNGQTTQTATGLAAGLYTVTVTSFGGGAVNSSVNLTQPAVLNVTAVITKATCASATNGSINQSVTGGVAPWTYVWSNGAAVQDLFNLAPGTYTCTTTDARGCQQVRTWVVGTQMVADAGPATVTRCSSAPCTPLGTGSSGPYSYSWYYFSNNGVPVGSMPRISAGTTPNICVANTVTRLYYLEVFQSSTGCRLRDSVWVQVLPTTDPSCTASNRAGGTAAESKAEEAEVSVYPNPFREVVQIEVDLPAADYVELEIVSLEGKYIRRFAGEPVDAGQLRFQWDGTDGSGRQVANGMYVYRLRIGQRILFGRIEFLR
jgi:hypothetical protein